MGSDAATLVVRAVRSEYAILMILASGGSLGRARFELRKVAARLQEEL